ncbi:hypothetical protein GA0115246_105285 [Streptomyces sp. SolWspMP-sol7th]|nr:hypothetical protein GA0115246_105285 [Streptomyces sp. SolWspMP-sol7th]
MEAAFGRAAREAVEPGAEQSVLGLVECGGESGAAGGSGGGAGGVEEGGDRGVDGGDGGTFGAEAVRVAGSVVRGREQEAQGEEPGSSGEEGEGTLPARLGQRHPGADGGRDEYLGADARGDRPDSAHGAGEEAEHGEDEWEEERLGGVREECRGAAAEQQSAGAGEGGGAEAESRGAAAAGAVVDGDEEAAERGHDTEPRLCRHDGQDERQRAQQSAHHGAARHRHARDVQGVGEPGGQRAVAESEGVVVAESACGQARSRRQVLGR